MCELQGGEDMSEGERLSTQGEALAEKLFGNKLGDVADLALPAGDDFPKEIVTWLFGYLLSERKHLTLEQKLLCLISMCTVRRDIDMLRRWIPAAREAGCSREVVRETMITMLVYGGWPAARASLEVLAEVWPEASA